METIVLWAFLSFFNGDPAWLTATGDQRTCEQYRTITHPVQVTVSPKCFIIQVLKDGNT